VQEQINAGLITQDQAKLSNNKNLVTRALGIDPEVELELQEFDTEVSDIYLLCSDGLSDLVNDEEIAQILLEAKGDIGNAAKDLIHAANESGGTDNTSVIIAKIRKEFTSEKGWVKNLFKKIK
jgi:protein phosphatase